MQTVAKRLNYMWRVAATGVAFFLFGLGGLVLGLFFMPLIWVYRSKPDLLGQKLRAIISASFRLFVNYLAAVGILEYHLHHSERLHGAQLVVANHPTLLDVVFLVSFMPNAVCVLKETLFHRPSIGFVVRNAGYISNKDPQTSIDDCVAALEHGESVIIFPEGTRSTPGQSSKLHRGAAYISMQAQVPMRPIHISCVPSSLTKAEKWYQIPDRKMQFDFTVATQIDQQQDLQADSRGLQARSATEQLNQALFKERSHAAHG